MDRRLNQVARNAEGAIYVAAGQMGNRWLDDHRLIFWSVLQKKAFLWDTESLEATEIGLREMCFYKRCLGRSAPN